MPGSRLLLLLLWLLGGVCSDVSAAGATNAAFPTLAEVEAGSPIRLAGTVTFVDAARQRLVLQQGDEVLALHVELPWEQIRVGQRVELEGILGPFFSACPNYPDRPDGREVRGAFEAPMNWGELFLSRLSGVITPPATGHYTFWVASDDSSELWLSETADRSKARRIALVPSGRWTEPHQWTRLPSQQSARISLEAGKSYYLEALGQDTSNRDNLAVAWQGPGLAQTVIAGRHVSPALAGATNHGVLWEYWTNFSASDFSVLRATNRSVLKLTAARLLTQEPGTLPAPVRIREGQPLDAGADFRPVELEGRVNFLSKVEGQWRLELRCGRAKVLARLPGDGDLGAVLPNEALIRVSGFFEPAPQLEDAAHSGTLWATGATAIAWINRPENWALVEELPQHRLSSANPELAAGRLVRAHGRVVAREADDLWRLDGRDTLQGYVSPDGTNWSLAGPTVELNLSPEVLVGFALSSHRTNELATVDVDQMSGFKTTFTGADIGGPPLAGACTETNGSLRLQGSGSDIWHQADQCFFAYQKLTGDFQIRARLRRSPDSDYGAKSVLMVRASLEPASPWAGVVLMPENRAGVQSRVEPSVSASGAITPLSAPVQWVKLVRHRNTFLVRAPSDALKPGELFEVMGEVGWHGQGVVLERTRIRKWPAPLETTPAVAPVDPPAGEYREVPVAEIGTEAKLAVKFARQAILKIRGVLTFNGQVGDDWLSFVQDQSGSARIQWKVRSLSQALQVGDLVEMTGTPSLPESGAELLAHGVTRLGVGELPNPLRPRTELPKAGAADGRWMEIEGVGRASEVEGRLLLMSRAGPVEVLVGTATGIRPTNWVNALVRVRGVLWRQSNPLLLLPADHCVQILEASPEDPFGIPIFPVQKLQRLDGELRLARRLKVVGTVSCLRQDYLMLQDQTGGLRVEGRAGFGVKVGDAIEAVGFPTERGSGVVLTGAILRPTGRHETLSPAGLDPENLVHVASGGRLVSVEAVLLAQHLGGDLQTLDVQSGPRTFQVSLPVADGRLPQIAVGSRLQLTGVAVAEGAGASVPDGAGDLGMTGSLELLLRSPGDVVVVERPPWWNWKYTVASVGLVVVVFVGAVLWIRTLRRRVEERTRELRETMGKLQRETQISATLAERDRLAAEIHDSVEQGLSAIMMQMEAATMVEDPQEMKRHVTLARNMAGFSRAEVQHAVWDLQSPLLENADLITALRRVAHDISAGDTPRVTLEVTGSVFHLASKVEHHLLRIAQEAITNAVKHGNPRTISVTLQYDADALMMTVRDDGVGFTPETTTASGGHFGLQGMRTRAGKIRAELRLDSRPGAGTAIQIRVPRRPMTEPDEAKEGDE